MVGYRRSEQDPCSGEEAAVFDVLPTGWKEICKGFDAIKAAELCAAADFLVRDEEGRYQFQVRLPGIGKTRAYKITANRLC